MVIAEDVCTVMQLYYYSIFVYNSSVFFLDKLKFILLLVLVWSFIDCVHFMLFLLKRQIASLLVFRPLLCVFVFMLLTYRRFCHIALKYKYYNRNSLSLYFHFTDYLNLFREVCYK